MLTNSDVGMALHDERNENAPELRAAGTAARVAAWLGRAPAPGAGRTIEDRAFEGRPGRGAPGRCNLTRRWASGFAIATAVMFALPLLPGAGGVAHAIVLVENINQSDDAPVCVQTNFSVAQQFLTGSNRNGYTLDLVELYIENAPDHSNEVAVSVFKGRNEPGTFVVRLNNPDDFGREEQPFTVPPRMTTTLEPNTRYWVLARFAGSIGCDFQWDGTNDNGQTGLTGSGWRISDTFSSSADRGSTWTAGNRALRMRVEGTVVPAPPSNLQAMKACGGSVTLEWDNPVISADNSGYDFKRYDIRYGPAPPSKGLRSIFNIETKTTTVTDFVDGTSSVSFTVSAVYDPDPPFETSATLAGIDPNPLVSTPPTNLVATTPGNRQVALTWMAPESISDYCTGEGFKGYQYRVFVPGGTGPWEPTEPTTDRMVTVMDLLNGREYRFEVRAVYEEGEGETATVTATPVGPPSEPLNLKPEAGDRQVTLTWEEPVDDGGTDILRYEYQVGGTGGWTPVGRNLEATVTGLTNGTSYRFEVRAVNKCEGEGEDECESLSATVTATPAGPPAAPRNLLAKAGDRQVTLTWDELAVMDNGGSPVLRYEYQVDGTGGWTSVGKNLEAIVTAGLVNGRQHTFAVRAVNAQGEGAAATVTATPAGTPPAPDNLSAEPADRKVTLTWEEPANDGGSPILRYEYRVDGTGDWTSVGLDEEVPVTGLTNGRPYRFEVRAVNEQGEGEAATVTETPATMPSVPLMLEATPGDGEVRLAWREPQSNGGDDIERYEYQYREEVGETTWMGPHSTGTNRQITVTSLANGTSYEFEVWAVNAQGAGEAATVMETPAKTPSAPRNLRATPYDGEVSLIWKAPGSDGGSPILRYEYQVDGGGWTSTDLLLGVTVTRLTNGRSYEFKVRAVTERGEGAAATVTATPALTPSAPLDLTATPGDMEVRLAWKAPESDGGSSVTRYEYRVDRSGDWISTHLLPRVTVSGLTNGRKYVFEVRAVNKCKGEDEDDVGCEGEAATVTATPVLTPPVPPGLTATPGDGQVRLAWGMFENNDVVLVERYEYQVDDGEWTSTRLNRWVTVTGLTNGRSYTFGVRAVNARGEGPAETVTATPALAPSAPLNLQAEPGDGQVRLTWDVPESSGGLAIDEYEYRVDHGGGWTSVGLDRRVTVTELTNGQPLINGRSYTFEVRAVNTHGDGEAATVTATPALTPSMPRNLRAAPGDREVTLTWDAPESAGGLDIERYEYQVDGSGDWVPVAGSDRRVKVPGLTNGRSYTFEVRAVNAHGDGEAATVTATPALSPSAPLDLTATPGDGEVRLTWKAPESAGGFGIERYEYRIDRGGGWTSVDLDLQVTVMKLKNDQPLINGRSYTFEVRAVNAHGNGEAATVTATPALPPSVPLNLRAAPGDGQVTLTWDAPESDGGLDIERYEYRVDGSGDWTSVRLDLQVTVMGLTNGQLYEFEVRAVNAHDNGEAATETATPALPPSAPRNLRAAPGNGEVTLTWDMPESVGGLAIDYYEYRVDRGGGWTSVRFGSAGHGEGPGQRSAVDQRSVVHLRGTGGERTRRRRGGNGDRDAGPATVGAAQSPRGTGRRPGDVDLGRTRERRRP